MKGSHLNNFARVRKRHFRILYSERAIFLLFGDLLMINLALFINYIVSLQSDKVFDISANIPWFVLLSVIWVIIRIAMDADDLNEAIRPADSAWNAAKAALITSIIFYIIPFIPPGLPRRRVELYLFPSFAVVGLVFWRMLYAVLLAKPFLFQRVLIIGAGQAGRTMLEIISQTGTLQKSGIGNGFHVIGFIDDNPSLYGKTVENVPIIGNTKDLSQLIEEQEIDKLILAITHQHTISQELMQTIYSCRELGIPITTMAHLFEQITGRVPLEHAGSNLPVIMPIGTSGHFRIFLIWKRIFDIFFGLLGCLGTIVVLPVVWLIYRITDGGPIFSCQPCAGQWRQPMNVHTFRIHKDNTIEKSYTHIGHLLSLTKFQKFPIFWLILKGEMSLIGPRPTKMNDVQKVISEFPVSMMRFAIKPGIIGWSQVRHRNHSGSDNQLISLQYDLYYLKHEGAFLDTLIFLKALQMWLGFKLK